MSTGYNSLSSNNDNLIQLRAWIWEAGVKLGFEDICQRIESQLDDKDILKYQFKEGRRTTLLFIARKLQETIKEAQRDKCISLESLKCLLNLTVQLLSDPEFHNENEFIRSLICLYYSALLLVFIKTGKNEEGALSLSVPYHLSEWQGIKETLGFKDDFYKEHFIKISEVANECRNVALKKKLRSKDISKSMTTLRSRLQNLYTELVNLLSPAALLNICNKETREELKRLHNPAYNILLKHMKSSILTSKCLHSLVDDLTEFSLQGPPSSQESSDDAEMKRKTSNSSFKNCLQMKRELSGSKHHEKIDLFEPKCKNRILKNYNIVILKDVLWELKNINSLYDDDDDCEPFIFSREIVNVSTNGLNQTETKGTFKSVHENVYQIHVKKKSEKDEALVNGSDTLEKLSRDIDGLDKLTESVKNLVAELESKCKGLQKKRELLLKSKGNTLCKSSSKTNENGDGGFEFKEQESAKVVSLDLRSNTPETCQDENLSYGKFKSGLGNNSDERFSPTSHDISDVSMPILTNYQMDNEEDWNGKHSFLSNDSTNTMPNLTPHRKSPIKTNPIVKLTPLSQSTINLYYNENHSETSDNEATSDSRKRKRKGSDSVFKSKKRKRSSSEEKMMSSADKENTSFSKIDLLVTKLHSPTENNAIILESNGKASSPCQEKEVKINKPKSRLNKKASPTSNKRLAITSSSHRSKLYISSSDDASSDIDVYVPTSQSRCEMNLERSDSDKSSRVANSTESIVLGSIASTEYFTPNNSPSHLPEDHTNLNLSPSSNSSEITVLFDSVAENLEATSEETSHHKSTKRNPKRCTVALNLTEVKLGMEVFWVYR